MRYFLIVGLWNGNLESTPNSAFPAEVSSVGGAVMLRSGSVTEVHLQLVIDHGLYLSCETPFCSDFMVPTFQIYEVGTIKMTLRVS